MWPRRQLPSNVRRSLPLGRGERILAAAPNQADRWVVATGRALYLPTADPDPPAYRRQPWERVDRAEWDRDAEVLRIVEDAAFGEKLPVTSLILGGDRAAQDRLLAVIRERITASVVVATHVGLRGDLGVRVVGRRAPGQDDDLTWSVVFDSGLDPDLPGVLDDAERALADVRSEVEP